MTDVEILNGIRDVLRTHLEVSEEVGMDTPLVESLALDSLRMLTLVVELENRFHVHLKDEDEEGLTRIGDVVALLRRRLA
ncbi:MAG TPA: phosphopantetheine-binding protein [Candidatus Methylomirabilis sp.]|nr:phosphopantetheine-binding protein [Candidatus Methylomirabilis sp.]